MSKVSGIGVERTSHQLGIRDGLHRAARAAFATAGVSWAECYHEDRGDGLFVLAPANVPKAVFVELLPHGFVTAVRVHNATHPEEQRVRLRLAIHAGEVHYDQHGVAGAALNLAFRLVDGKPLKAALASSPGVLAVITSDRFFDDVVRHSPGAAPATYRSVQVTVKETTTVGWIALPDHPYPLESTRLTMPPTGQQYEPTPSLVPRQLPPAVRDFTGRTEHLAMLDAMLPAEDDESTGAVVISAVDGAAGIGKTALAVRWAHRVQNGFPDGTLHANLRGYGPGDPATPVEVLDGFLRALGMPAERMPMGLEAHAGLYRSLLAGRRLLIVLDNANSADQVRPLLPGAAGCMVLVTSRDSLTGLVVTDGARRLTLDLLTEAEALQLVSGIVGPVRVAAKPDAVTEMIRLCARLPLALRIAAGRVAANP
jgi:hypothetical protein